jgi:hypothetical protein
MFKNWRCVHSYFLLSAIVFKSMIMGMLFALSSHNICLERLQTMDVNWQQHVCKQRKKPDDLSIEDVFNTGEAALCYAGISQSPTFISRLLRVIRQHFINAVFWKTNNSFSLRIPFVTERIFLQYCALLR